MILNLVRLPTTPPITIWGSKLKRLGYLNAQSHVDMWYLALRHADAMDKRGATWYHSFSLFDNAAFTHQMSLFTEGMYQIMAKKSAPARTNSDRPEWKGFIDYRLNESHLEQFDNTQFDHVAVLEAYATLLVEGYRITHSYNAQNKTFTTTMIDNRAVTPLGGWALSAQGSTYFEAWSMLIYKHFVALDGDWTTVHSPEKSVRRG